MSESNLTKCPECGGTVSRKATTCPHCGFPFDRQRHVTVEQQKKVYKANKIGAVVAIGLGIGIASWDHPTWGPAGVVIAILGGVWFLVASIAAWWNHG